MGGAENRSAHSQRPPARLFFGVPAARVKSDGCGCRRRRCGSRERDGDRCFRSLPARPSGRAAVPFPGAGGRAAAERRRAFGLAGADEVLIGRGPGRRATRARSGGATRLTVTANSTFLSSAHARLREEPDGWTIEDLGSRNGVFVNGQQVTRAVLGPGDVVALGRVFFLVEFHEVPGGRMTIPASAISMSTDASRTRSRGLLTLLPGPRESRIERAEARRNSAVTVVGETGTGKEVARARDSQSFRPRRTVPRDQLRLHPARADSERAVRQREGRVFGRDRQRRLRPRRRPRDAAPGRDRRRAARGPGGAAARAAGEGGDAGRQHTRHPVDVRFVAAAQRPLADAVAAGGFRKDLQGGSNHSSSSFRRSGSESRTSGSWSRPACSPPASRRRTRHASPPKPRCGCSATTGPSTCASSRTRSSARGRGRRAASSTNPSYRNPNARHRRPPQPQRSAGHSPTRDPRERRGGRPSHGPRPAAGPPLDQTLQHRPRQLPVVKIQIGPHSQPMYVYPTS